MSLNLLKSTVLEAITQSTSRTLFTTGTMSSENGALASFLQFGLPKTQGTVYLISPYLIHIHCIVKLTPFSARLQRYVTLKILKANVSSDSQELSILLHLSKASTDCPGRNIVLQLLDHFEHRSPNGLHLCLVFPVMMSDGEAMTVRERPRYSDYVRNISKQLLQGLNFIHDQGLIHGGMYLWRRRASLILMPDRPPTS